MNDGRIIKNFRIIEEFDAHKVKLCGFMRIKILLRGNFSSPVGEAARTGRHERSGARQRFGSINNLRLA
jgi:hypothetical protein